MQLSFGFRPTVTSIRGRDKSVIDLVVAENVVAEKCRIKPQYDKSPQRRGPPGFTAGAPAIVMSGSGQRCGAALGGGMERFPAISESLIH